jgi:probable O-glycosylation ligase (exosortase A-associated)
VLSIGFYSFKGGIFTLIHGGHYRVYGPVLSYIEENNALGLASLMIMPLAYYLYHATRKRALKWALGIFTFLTIVSVLGSQSRGAFVAVLAVGGFFWLKSRSKLVSGIIIALLVGIGFSIMSDTWFDRMETIRNYKQDASAMSRLNAWAYNVNLAADRIVGGGFRSESTATFSVYAPNPDDVHAAHSIFFGVLGDHGWIGLLLFLTILFFTWRSLSFVIRQTRDGDSEVDSQKNLLARMLQVSLIAYASGGAFLSLAYFDLPWHIIAISVLLRSQLIPHKGREEEAGAGVGEKKRVPVGSRDRNGLRSGQT